MRIIAGEFRSRMIYSPPDDATRPITDRVKESLFAILRGHLEGAAVIDLFSGTGSLGLEAISRGATRVTFVEKSRECVKVLKDNIEMLGVGDLCEVVTGDALSATSLARADRSVHLVFVDPPYEMLKDERGRVQVLAQMGRAGERLDEDGYLVLRTPWPFDTVLLAAAGLVGPETHAYSRMAVHFFQRSAER